jgi:hypothetical protein
MKRKMILLLVGLVCVFVVVLSGCGRVNSSQTYFGGKVLVQYQGTDVRGENDSLTFTFNQPGEYRVDFSYTPGQEKFGSLPANFTIVGPLSKVIQQEVLPNYLRVSITYEGQVEFHDFSYYTAG